MGIEVFIGLTKRVSRSHAHFINQFVVLLLHNLKTLMRSAEWTIGLAFYVSIQSQGMISFCLGSRIDVDRLPTPILCVNLIPKTLKISKSYGIMLASRICCNIQNVFWRSFFDVVVGAVTSPVRIRCPPTPSASPRTLGGLYWVGVTRWPGPPSNQPSGDHDFSNWLPAP